MQLRTAQNDLTILYKFEFVNGLAVTILVSPLSPEAGREVLGAFTEDYVLVGTLLSGGRVYPILRGVKIAEAFIRDRLNVDPPISNLLFEIMPRLTTLDVPDLIAQDAERWYSNYYGLDLSLV